MRLLGDVAEHVLAQSHRAAAQRAERVHAEIGDDSLRDYLTRAHGEALAALVPREATLAEFLDGTSDHVVEAATERLRLCQRCTGAPARCAGRQDQLLQVGLLPTWTHQGLDALPCGTFETHLLRERLQRAGVPKGMLDCSFETFEPVSELQRKALAATQAYVGGYGRGNPQRNGLLIIGDGFGIGKTHLAIAALRKLVEDGKSRRPYMLYVPAFLEAIRRSFDEKSDSDNRSLMRKATNADLLLLDDLGAERTTEWVQEQLLIILNARWSNGYATIVTTNARAKEINAALGDRAYSRLWGCMGKKILVQGEDRRRG